MITPQLSLTKRPFSQMAVAATASLGFVLAGILGIATGQLTLALNGYIIMVAGICEFLILRFWRSLSREIERSEAALHSCTGKTSSFISKIPRDLITPVFLSVLQDTLIKARNGRGADHGSILQAYETGLLQQPVLIGMIAMRIIVLLGMASTVLGLQLCMMAIGRGVQLAGDVAAISAAILPAVESLAMSFSTTATALVLGPLLLGVQSEYCRRAVEQYVDQVDAMIASFRCDDSPNQGDK